MAGGTVRAQRACELGHIDYVKVHPASQGVRARHLWGSAAGPGEAGSESLRDWHSTAAETRAEGTGAGVAEAGAGAEAEAEARGAEAAGAEARGVEARGVEAGGVEVSPPQCFVRVDLQSGKVTDLARCSAARTPI